MKKTTLITKYEFQLLQQYGLAKAALKKREDLRRSLDESKNDPPLFATYTLMYKINCEDITCHHADIAILEVIVHDLYELNSLS